MKKDMKTLLGTSGPFLGTVRQKKSHIFFRTTGQNRVPRDKIRDEFCHPDRDKTQN